MSILKKLLLIVCLVAVSASVNAQKKGKKNNKKSSSTVVEKLSDNESDIQISIADVRGDDKGVDLEEFTEHKLIMEEGNPDKPFDVVHQMPQFPGGEQAMIGFIKENLKYPVIAREAGIQGRVIVRFVVSRTGEVTDIKVVRGIDSQCDREAVRLVKLMPKWTPGKQNGRNVPVYFTIPVVFRLSLTMEENEELAKKPDVSSSDLGIDINDLRIIETSKKEEIYDPMRKPFVVVEQMPQFEGGEEAVRNFIVENLVYPKEAVVEGIQGRVTVRFIVIETGEVTDVQVVCGIDPSCDKEAVRLVQSMPKWIPGKQNGKEVPVYYTLPILFKLTASSESKAK